MSRAPVIERGSERIVLPEPQWSWRRGFTWSLTVANIGLLIAVVCLADREDLRAIGLALIGLNALLATIYLIAPSAPELAAIFGAFRTRIQFGGGSPRAPAGDPSPHEGEG